MCARRGISYDGKLDLLLKKLSPVKEILIVCRSEEDAIKLENSGFTVKNKIKNEITIKIKNDSITSSLKTILNFLIILKLKLISQKQNFLNRIKIN